MISENLIPSRQICLAELRRDILCRSRRKTSRRETEEDILIWVLLEVRNMLLGNVLRINSSYRWVVQERRNSSADALELRLSYTKPSIYNINMFININQHSDTCCMLVELSLNLILMGPIDNKFSVVLNYASGVLSNTSEIEWWYYRWCTSRTIAGPIFCQNSKHRMIWLWWYKPCNMLYFC